ncbi:DUF2059 domain-containing protein [Hahella sp. CR1]|uniref:DUF2059 domain-containing protein n=1 Tax=Hahella sp. CR1 TaxID=2992807 RepID=UPI0024411EF1|nr:DUF2059 domain-containing protein [Hahella sp. CR1]MDG9668908.1 DUF2059 domain-containing protein [Hahella sp. CR1]
MKLFRAIFCLLSAILLSTPVFAVKSDTSLSANLLAQTGVDELLSRYPDMIKTGIRANIRRTGASEDLMDLFERVVDGAYQADDLQSQVERRLEQQLSPAEMRHVLQWYRSPIGQKIVAAELNAMSSEEYAEAQKRMERLSEENKGGEREHLFSAYDRATLATDSMLDNTVTIQLAMAAAITSVVKGPELPSYHDLKRVIEERRFSIRGMVGQQVYLNYLYTYRDVPLADMKGYIAFARTDAGARFVEVLKTALFDVLQERSEVLGERLNQLAGAQ